MLSKKSIIFTFMRMMIFVILPLSISIVMFSQIKSSIRGLMEDEAARNAEYQSELISQEISKNTRYLQIVSDYISAARTPEKEMEHAISNIVPPEQLSRTGILRLDDSAVCGRNLAISDYIAIRKAFRGTSYVTYSPGEGFLFTVPVYNNENNNIKYVLYEFFDAKEIFDDVIVDVYSKKAQFAMTDSDNETVSVISGDDDNINYYFDADYQNVVAKINNKIGHHTSAAVYNERDGKKELCFVSLTNCRNLYLIGKVPYQEVADSAESLYRMVIMVSMFQIALLLIGTLNILFADKKIRESNELRKAKAAAEKANKAKGEFIASMSHELRTPINVILGMNEMILREEADSKTKEHAMDVKSAAQILLSLINDVLDYTKIESGKMNIIDADYNLVTLVNDLALLTETRAYQKSIEFVLDVDPDLPVGLHGDDIRIRQVLTNLLTNAVKYTSEGRVTLKITGKPVNKDEILLKFEVIDTGIGIKREDIDKLLVPYMRIEEERNRNVEGTGLGMPIIVNLLMLMGSMLQVDSIYGEGSDFWFEIRQNIVDRQPVGDIKKRLDDIVKEYNYRVSFIAPKAKVLVVDDNSMNRQIFVSLLSKTQISISTASSGMKCLELVKKEHFDIIFMDHLMPEMSGIETLHALKKLEGNLCKDTPVVALTANAFTGDREKYLSYGFDDFLTKPIVTEKLEALIMHMLPKEYVSVKTEETEEQPAADSGANELPEVEGLNLGIAKMYLKDNALIFNSLKDYYERIENDIDELPELYEKINTPDGLKNYRISVHALKSSSAVVGIMTASELARVLEYASRDGDINRIKSVHPILMEEIKRMLGRLEPYKPEETEATGNENFGDLSDQLAELRSLMDQMDFDALDEAVKKLNDFSCGGKLKKLIDKLCDDINFTDFESANATIDRITAIIEK